MTSEVIYEHQIGSHYHLRKGKRVFQDEDLTVLVWRLDEHGL